ncbi:MAG: DsrE family protein [Syntrophales bacterium]|nr:DsrE family protein [Syntrophales bacterium]MDD5643458.1 DsrE family protein [Syntrophales bacterium]
MSKFLFIISKGLESSGSATRALQFASLAAAQDKHVEVFLIDDAVHWAQVGMAEGIRSTTGEVMKDFLEELVGRNCPLHACKA